MPTNKWRLIFLILSISIFLEIPTSEAQDTTQKIISWLTQNSFPIRDLELGKGFSDLQPLKKILQDVQVIGMGEATHGTREFFQFKARLVEFLVSEMGFTALALESTFSNCEPVNDYILSGNGDLYSALTQQGYSVWDTEEFADLLMWLREYNRKVSDERKVHFYGIDFIAFPIVGADKTIAYFKSFAPAQAYTADSILHMLANKKGDSSTIISLNRLIKYFLMNKDKLVLASSLDQWEQTSKYLEVIEQRNSIFYGVPASLQVPRQSRDEYMTNLFFYVIQKERPNVKIMFWAHNGHVGIDTLDDYPGGKTIGYNLRQTFGKKYYAIGLQCNEGTYLARLQGDEGVYKAFTTDTILAIQNSFAWYLNKTEKGNSFIDFRLAPTNFLIDQWLDKEMMFVDATWHHMSSKENYDTIRLKGKYDGIMYLEHSTPSHLTKNALTGIQQP